jgi:tRNA-Thr(GGU) m(6)t(6)A37 methyltransferase TsaA
MKPLTEIGIVKSAFKEKADPFEMRTHESKIIVHKKYREGLFCLDESAYIQVIFGFHLSDGYTLKGPVYNGKTKGVFASRSPNRPSPLGVTTVKLLKIDDTTLTVTGLDAADGSPVYDIKPFAPIFDECVEDDIKKKWSYSSPRIEMITYIRSGNLSECLSEAGKLHGHYCPGLTLGVYASVSGMQKLFPVFSDGMEHLLAIIEVNSCFADGVQYVTGCTFGNNALIYRDLGKTSVTLAIRGKPEGLRITVKPGFRDILNRDFPEFSTLFNKVVKERSGDENDMAAFMRKSREASYSMLSYPVDTLFSFKEIPVQLPPYAPMVNTVLCSECGEEVMESKAVKQNESIYCRTCIGSGFPSVTGEGIVSLIP